MTAMLTDVDLLQALKDYKLRAGKKLTEPVFSSQEPDKKKFTKQNTEPKHIKKQTIKTVPTTKLTGENNTKTIKYDENGKQVK